MASSGPAFGGEPTHLDPATLYAQANLRRARFTHFSASRRDARTQFVDWSGREPAIPQSSNRQSDTRQAGAWQSADWRFAGGQLEKTPDSAGDSASPRSGGWPAPPVQQAESFPQDSGENAGAELLPQWLTPAEEIEASAKEAVRGTLVEAAARDSSRWLLLNEVFPSPAESSFGGRDAAGRPHPAPVLMAFSLAGGVGKTTLLATLGRALAARGERILLADTAGFSLAPCYFGAPVARPAGSSPAGRTGEVPPGLQPGREAGPAPSSLRTFSPPGGSRDAPLDFLFLRGGEDCGRRSGERGGPDPLREALLRNGRKSHRILVDVQSGSESLARRLLSLDALVLAPLLPDMNSAVTVAAVEEAFAARAGGPGKLVYLLNQFDASLPLHLDVRAVLERRLGGRLLPFALRRAPEVSEALAEGMTVIDYAPNSPVAEDYARLADWLRSVAPAASRGLEQLRWSEL